VLSSYERATKPGSDPSFSFEHRARAADGTVRWLLAHGRVFFEGDRPVRVVDRPALRHGSVARRPGCRLVVGVDVGGSVRDVLPGLVAVVLGEAGGCSRSRARPAA
jgi:hypothetical protein